MATTSKTTRRLDKVNNTRKTAIAIGAAQLALMASGAALAQTEPTTVVVYGQRAALESAQNIKKNADEIVDSIVADDIGKLPDKSVTEVLQRVVGVSIDRTMNRVDPQQGVGDSVNHYAAEGTGVSIRGLGAGQVRSEFNGRDAFSANGGRALSFEDVPPELMAGVDVYKNPSAEQIEGGIGGLVNLRTALPFDVKGRKVSLSTEVSRSSLRGKTAPPSVSGLYSDRWDTQFGQVGVLIDLAHSKIANQSDSLSISPYSSRDDLVPGKRVWVTPSASWGENTFDRTRDGLYGALQWKKGDLSSHVTFLRSRYKQHSDENSYFGGTNPATLSLDPGATYDANGALLTGTLRDTTNSGPGFGTGLGFGTDARASGRTSDTRDVSWSGAWRASEAWSFKADLQHVQATTDGYDNTVGLGGWVPGQTVDLRGGMPSISFDQGSRAWLADPSHYYWGFTQVHHDVAKAQMNTARLDAKYTFDHPILNDLRFGVRVTDRSAVTQSTHDSEWTQISQGWAVGNQSWQPLAQFAGLGDPRFAHGFNLHEFKNFFGGSAASPVPVIVPDASLANSVDAITQLHTYYTTLCNEANATGRNNDCSYKPPKFGDAIGLNDQHERTQAAYAQLRFAFDKLAYPVDGNVGVRVVRTNAVHAAQQAAAAGRAGHSGAVGEADLREHLHARAAEPEPAPEGQRRAAVPPRAVEGHVASGLLPAAGLHDARHGHQDAHAARRQPEAGGRFDRVQRPAARQYVAPSGHGHQPRPDGRVLLRPRQLGDVRCVQQAAQGRHHRPDDGLSAEGRHWTDARLHGHRPCERHGRPRQRRRGGLPDLLRQAARPVLGPRGVEQLHVHRQQHDVSQPGQRHLVHAEGHADGQHGPQPAGLRHGRQGVRRHAARGPVEDVV
jgi:TonB-dependent receptor